MVGGHAKTAFLHAAISAAAHQRQRRHGLKKKSTFQIRLRRIFENTVRLSKSLSVYSQNYALIYFFREVMAIQGFSI
jgi:hypothetical protein